MRRQDILAGSLSLLVLWAPLPGGSMPPAAELWFRLSACGLFVLAIAARGERWHRRRVLPGAALAAVATLGLVQSCSWPSGLAGLVSPAHVALHAEAAGLVEEAAPAWVPLSLDVTASRSSAVSWLAAAALMSVALVAGRRRRHRRWLLGALVLAALIELGYGLLSIHLYTPGGLSVLLLPEGRLRGTFANPNHMSLLFEIGLAVVAAWIWHALTGSSRRAVRRGLAAIAPLALWLVLLAGVVLTGSRAGLAAAAVGCGVQLTWMLLAARGRGSRLAALTLAVAVAMLIALGTRIDIRRYEAISLFEENLYGRLVGIVPAVELWLRFPATGTGLGTFEDAFPLEAPPQFSTALWNRAHNDPLELLVTGGLLGLALGALAVASLLPPIFRVLRRNGASEDRAAGLAALGVLAAVGFHELLDFGLVIPANHLAVLVVLGAAAAGGLSPPPVESRD